MRITKDKVVTFEYVVTDESGVTLDSSKTSNPLSYIHGMGNIVPGLESRLEGKQSGDSFSATVPPEQGYGERDESLFHTFTEEELADLGKLAVGMQLQTQDGSGKQKILTVTGMEDGLVTMDENHPLAGRTISFDVTVLSVRDATSEELEQGHAYDVACNQDCSSCGLDQRNTSAGDCDCGCNNH